MKYTPARSFAAKTIAAGVAAVTFASAGVALAASGNLPSDGPGNGWGFGLQKDEAEEIEPVEEEVTDEETTDEDVVEEGTTEEEVTEEETTDETPAAFNGLCRAFSAGNKDTTGKALEAPPFLALSEAAGGAENVALYCETILAEKSGKPEADEDTETGNPSAEKSQKSKNVKKAKKDRPERPERPQNPHADNEPGDETGDNTP